MYSLFLLLNALASQVSPPIEKVTVGGIPRWENLHAYYVEAPSRVKRKMRAAIIMKLGDPTEFKAVTLSDLYADKGVVDGRRTTTVAKWILQGKTTYLRAVLGSGKKSLDGAVCRSESDAKGLRYYSFQYVKHSRHKCIYFWWSDETKDYEVGW